MAIGSTGAGTAHVSRSRRLTRWVSMASLMSRLTAYRVALCLFLVGHGFPLHVQAAPADQKIEFDIPAQPLAKALVAYGAATGLEVFYNASLAGGLQSARVTGTMTAETALRVLLQGTDYTARSTGPGAFTILQTTGDAAMASAGAATRGQLEPYFASLQRGISDAMCRNPQSPAVRTEFVSQFWVSRSGVVERIDVLTEDGDRAADHSFAAAIRGLALPPPPAGLPQPINMVIFPPASGSSACRDSYAPRRAGFAAP